MGSSGIFGIGISALNAAQAGIVTTGHNIANANTPGYSRQQTIQTANNPLASGSGFFGQGVQVSTVQRVYSDFLTTQVNQAKSQSSQLSTYSTQINQIESLLGSSTTGFEPAIQAFFSAVQGVANYPSSVPSRQAMLSASQSLVSSFQTVGQQLNGMQSSVNSQITSSVASINSYAQQIAQLNQSIVAAQNSSGGQPPNDLMDQRDQLVAQLSQQIQTTVLKQSDGSYSVFIGSGQGLVVGNQAMSLSAVSNPADPTQTVVGFSLNGTSSVLPDSSIVGGNLGGLYAYRSQSLDVAQNAMGRIAVGLAQTFNQQSQLGQDLNGNPGTAYFNVPSPVVIANSANAAGASANVTLSNATPTTKVAVTANLSSSSVPPATSPFSAANPTSYNFVTNGTVYDSLGQAHSIATYYVDTATPNQWQAYTYVDGNSADGGTPSTLAFNAGGSLASATNLAKSVTLTNGAASPLAFNMDFSNMTQTAAANSLTSVTSDGNANTSASQLTGADYTLRYDGTTSTWSLLNNTTNQTVTMTGSGTSASPFIADGMSMVVSPPTTSTQSASFLIKPTVNGAQDISLNISDTSLIAAASPLKTSSAVNASGTSTNGGNAVISAATVNAQNVDLQDPVAISFNNPATTYTVTDTKTGMVLTPPGGAAYTSGSPISFNGWTVNITGTPSPGDSFTVGPNTGGATDNTNALLLAGLQTKNTLIGNTASYEGAYSQLVSEVGNTANQMQVMSTSQSSLVNQLTQSQQSVSGVNLDEEAANLIRYQQAYQAAGKMMQIANTLFNSILQI